VTGAADFVAAVERMLDVTGGDDSKGGEPPAQPSDPS
jgi:hypothetical protein